MRHSISQNASVDIWKEIIIKNRKLEILHRFISTLGAFKKKKKEHNNYSEPLVVSLNYNASRFYRETRHKTPLFCHRFVIFSPFVTTQRSKGIVNTVFVQMFTFRVGRCSGKDKNMCVYNVGLGWRPHFLIGRALNILCRTMKRKNGLKQFTIRMMMIYLLISVKDKFCLSF